MAGSHLSHFVAIVLPRVPEVPAPSLHCTHDPTALGPRFQRLFLCALAIHCRGLGRQEEVPGLLITSGDFDMVGQRSPHEQ